MPVYHRHFEPGHLQFITPSTYRRVPIFSTPSFDHLFVEAFRAVRSKPDFLLVGWVLMPEHFNLLFQPWPAESAPHIMKEVKQRSAHAILAALAIQPELPSCRAALRSFRLPPTVHDQAHYRVWQRRFVPFNVFTERKFLEKLDSMHNNPVRRGRVASRGVGRGRAGAPTTWVTGRFWKWIEWGEKWGIADADLKGKVCASQPRAVTEFAVQGAYIKSRRLRQPPAENNITI